jgi:hypothetical protein
MRNKASWLVRSLAGICITTGAANADNYHNPNSFYSRLPEPYTPAYQKQDNIRYQSILASTSNGESDDEGGGLPCCCGIGLLLGIGAVILYSIIPGSSDDHSEDDDIGPEPPPFTGPGRI